MFDNDDDPLAQQLQQRKENALKALESFTEKYVPATAETVETYYSSTEISNTVCQHAGFQLENAEVFEMLNNMGYKYELKDGSEFLWLMKKEQ